ncbi:MAG TPA: VPLPA-CTERM-specific exosortase XrtD [Gammaproteobacteria bacterium]|nr:VPLPA-CTERM-specific exosortase XrtD [Gammaproteobacteria bacterium]
MEDQLKSQDKTDETRWRSGPVFWLCIIAAGLLLFGIFQDSVIRLVDRWSGSEEYGYGFLIPFISAFLIWQKKDELELIDFKGAWAGWLLVVAGLGLYFIGQLATLYIIMQYSLVLTIAGLVWALVGWNGIKRIWVPLLFLVFMIPLPNFLYRGLSAALQLVSSELGVMVIRAFGISVYLEGNVIDLGTYKLQVVEACSGLRYLFPLMSLSFMVAYFYREALWKKAVVFLSSIPITVLMNSFRIGMIGVLVEYGGPEQAEGFLHDFEGWVVFMACIMILLLEMWGLAQIGHGGERRGLGDVFTIDLPPPASREKKAERRRLSAPFLASVAVLVPALVAGKMLGTREEVIPQRPVFAEFPARIDGWRGHIDRIESIYLDALKLDDYLLADFARTEGPNVPVNLYVAYYASQRAGESIHSPRSCIPGGGWKIVSVEPIVLEGVAMNGKPVRANRTVIQKGETKQIVYYWFQGRGRNLVDEYRTKFYLLVDAVQKKRTDGALVRLTTMVLPAESERDADSRLRSFATVALPVLDRYIPE